MQRFVTKCPRTKKGLPTSLFPTRDSCLLFVRCVNLYAGYHFIPTDPDRRRNNGTSVWNEKKMNNRALCVWVCGFGQGCTEVVE